MTNRSSASAARPQLLRLAYYTASHLVVDMCCFYILYGGVISAFDGARSTTAAVLCFLMYNTLAFGLQLPFGMAADSAAKKGRSRQAGMAVLGCAIIAAAAAALLLPTVTTLPARFAAICAALAAAVGNALFHVGGGVDTLRSSGGNMAPNGVFVSSGALGVALGTLGGRYHPLFAPSAGRVPCAAVAALALAACLMCAAARSDINHRRGESPAVKGSTGHDPLTVILLALAVVVLRSLVGSYTSAKLSWDSAVLIGTMPALCAACGKALGGIAGDRLGARATALISLPLSIGCFAAGFVIPEAMLAGVLLFNMTMPVTLCMIAREMPEHPGTAFGLTTVGLLLGSLPAFLVSPAFPTRMMICLPLIAVSTFMLVRACAAQEQR